MVQCGVCLEEDGNIKEVGELSGPGCNHAFCFPCITRWSGTENRCPTCRARFTVITRKRLAPEAGHDEDQSNFKRHKGVVMETIAVPDKVQEWRPDEELATHLENLYCLVCNGQEDEQHLMLCDGCDRGFHSYCVQLEEIPPGEWFCEECQLQQAPHATATRRRTGVRAVSNQASTLPRHVTTATTSTSATVAAALRRGRAGLARSAAGARGVRGAGTRGRGRGTEHSAAGRRITRRAAVPASQPEGDEDWEFLDDVEETSSDCILVSENEEEDELGNQVEEQQEWGRRQLPYRPGASSRGHRRTTRASSSSMPAARLRSGAAVTAGEAAAAAAVARMRAADDAASALASALSNRPAASRARTSGAVASREVASSPTDNDRLLQARRRSYILIESSPSAAAGGVASPGTEDGGDGETLLQIMQQRRVAAADVNEAEQLPLGNLLRNRVRSLVAAATSSAAAANQSVVPLMRGSARSSAAARLRNMWDGWRSDATAVIGGSSRNSVEGVAPSDAPSGSAQRGQQAGSSEGDFWRHMDESRMQPRPRQQQLRSPVAPTSAARLRAARAVHAAAAAAGTRHQDVASHIPSGDGAARVSEGSPGEGSPSAAQQARSQVQQGLQRGQLRFPDLTSGMSRPHPQDSSPAAHGAPVVLVADQLGPARGSSVSSGVAGQPGPCSRRPHSQRSLEESGNTSCEGQAAASREAAVAVASSQGRGSGGSGDGDGGGCQENGRDGGLGRSAIEGREEIRRDGAAGGGANRERKENRRFWAFAMRAHGSSSQPAVDLRQERRCSSGCGGHMIASSDPVQPRGGSGSAPSSPSTQTALDHVREVRRSNGGRDGVVSSGLVQQGKGSRSAPSASSLWSMGSGDAATASVAGEPSNRATQASCGPLPPLPLLPSSLPHLAAQPWPHSAHPGRAAHCFTETIMDRSPTRPDPPVPSRWQAEPVPMAPPLLPPGSGPAFPSPLAPVPGFARDGLPAATGGAWAALGTPTATPTVDYVPGTPYSSEVPATALMQLGVKRMPPQPQPMWPSPCPSRPPLQDPLLSSAQHAAQPLSFPNRDQTHADAGAQPMSSENLHQQRQHQHQSPWRTDRETGVHSHVGDKCDLGDQDAMAGRPGGKWESLQAVAEGPAASPSRGRPLVVRPCGEG